VIKRFVREQGKGEGGGFSRLRTAKVNGTTRPSEGGKLGPGGFRSGGLSGAY
jgi:hypothetical protein